MTTTTRKILAGAAFLAFAQLASAQQSVPATGKQDPTAATTGTPTADASKSPDPFVQKRQSDSDAKADYKAKKKAAKAEYKSDKKEAKTDLKSEKKQSSMDRKDALANTPPPPKSAPDLKGQ